MAATFTPPLAALTTVFTPPCPTTWLLTTTKVPSQLPPFPTSGPASCDLPSWTEYVSERGFEYYSPAICPSGFSIGPTCIITNPRTGQGFPAIQSGETAAYCVPFGHTCTSDTTDFRGGVWGVSRTASSSGARATVGPAIQIRWRDEDLSILETDPLTPGLVSTNIVAPVITSISTTTQSASETASTVTNPLTGLSSQSSTSTSSSSSSSSSSSTGSSTSSTESSTSVLSLGKSESAVISSTPTITTAARPTDASPPVIASSGAPPGNGAGASTQGKDSRGNNMSEFTVAATVLTTILITLILAYGTYTTLQKYRRYRAGETTTFFVFETGAWLRRRLRMNGSRRDDTLNGEKAGDGWAKNIPDAELGTDGPLPELGAGHPLGTKENPAELGSERRSWMSRVSRMFTVRSRNGSLVPVP
ncbi:hypothetical protein F5Y19DRAFT_399744 [Xylariaceae sp. FL1651]|nr:hypothetical protein F5Y19DRAFT_399744 [Xylariaceae sp. FL1651]